MICTGAQLGRIVEILEQYRNERLTASTVALAVEIARMEAAQ